MLGSESTPGIGPLQFCVGKYKTWEKSILFWNFPRLRCRSILQLCISGYRVFLQRINRPRSFWTRYSIEFSQWQEWDTGVWRVVCDPRGEKPGIHYFKSSSTNTISAPKESKFFLSFSTLTTRFRIIAKKVIVCFRISSAGQFRTKKMEFPEIKARWVD